MKTKEFCDIFRGFEFLVRITTPDTPQSEAPSPETTIVYIHGQAARNQHRKARNICEMAMALNCNFCWYELAGHNNNMEKYDQTDCNLWVDQLEYLLDNHTHGNIILVGACLGGVIGLVAASRTVRDVIGVICLNSADINWKEKLTLEQIIELQQQGYTQHYITDKKVPFKLTKQFIDSTDDIRKNINLKCPVHLLLGQRDPMVKLEEVISLQQKITSPEVITKLISNASHSMRDRTSMTEVFFSINSML